MKAIVILLMFAALIPVTAQARPREVFKIEIGTDYDKYSNHELRRRVWELERAVYQLQEEVFHLKMDNQIAKNNYGNNTWTCSIQSFGKTFTATNRSKGAARAEVLKDCSSASNAIHCDRDDVKCEK